MRIVCREENKTRSPPPGNLFNFIINPTDDHVACLMRRRIRILYPCYFSALLKIIAGKNSSRVLPSKN